MIDQSEFPVEMGSAWKASVAKFCFSVLFFITIFAATMARFDFGKPRTVVGNKLFRPGLI